MPFYHQSALCSRLLNTLPINTENRFFFVRHWLLRLLSLCCLTPKLSSDSIVIQTYVDSIHECHFITLNATTLMDQCWTLANTLFVECRSSVVLASLWFFSYLNTTVYSMRSRQNICGKINLVISHHTKYIHYITKWFVQNAWSSTSEWVIKNLANLPTIVLKMKPVSSIGHRSLSRLLMEFYCWN